MYSWLIIRCVVGEQINLLSPQYNKPILGVHRNRDNYIRICIFKEYLKLLNRFMKSVGWPKPGYASITCSIISNIPYNLIFTTRFNDSSILIPNISCDYLNLSWADEHVGDVTVPTQVIEYNHNFLQADFPIRLNNSNQIKLLGNK